MGEARPGGSAGSRKPADGGTWTVRGALGLCIVLALVAYRALLRFQTHRRLPEEIEEWFFVPTDSLGPLVLVLSAWLFYRRRARLRALTGPPGSLAGGVGLLAAGLGVYLWAIHTSSPDLLAPALMLHLAAAAWLWRGPAAVRVLSLPIAVLLFYVPVPAPALNQLIYALQIGTAEIAGRLLYFLGIPHFVAGEQILRTKQTFSVIESCCGLRSMETLSLVAVLMVDLFRRRPLHAWLVVLAAPPVAFLLNGVRALLLILNPHSQIATIHNLQGVAILLGGLVVLFLWDGVLEKLLPSPAGESPPAPVPRAAPSPRPAALGALAVTLALAVAASWWLPGFERTEPPFLGASERIAVGIGVSQELEVDRRFLGSVAFREKFSRRFDLNGEDAYLFVGIGSRTNRTGSPLSPKTGIPGSGWVVERVEPVELPDGHEVRALVMRHGSERMLVYRWYLGADGWPAEALRTLLALDRSRWRRPGEIIVVRLGVPIRGSLVTGRTAAKRKILSLYRQLRPLLQGIEDELSRKRFS